MTLSDMPPAMRAVAVAEPAEMLTRRARWRFYRPMLPHFDDGEALTYAPFGWFSEPRRRMTRGRRAFRARRTQAGFPPEE